MGICVLHRYFYARRVDVWYYLTSIMSNSNAVEQVKENLRSVYDPEISVNIFDLGLIYNVAVDSDMNCNILMSLTSAFCPSADDIVADVKYSALAVEGVKTCEVNVTFDPQWGPDMMSDEAKFELGIWNE